MRTDNITIAFILAVAVMASMKLYQETSIRVATIHECAKLAGGNFKFQMTSDGCQVGAWKVGE